MSKVVFERDGDVGIVTVNDPPLNLVGPELVDELDALANELPSMPLRALVMRAAGENFSAGADVDTMFKGRSADEAHALISRVTRLIPVYENLPYPTVAAVQGLCLAGGFEMALACDMIWAGESAQIGLVEAVIGVVPLGGGAQRLAERAGPARAREMVFGGGIYDAATMERWNIVNRVVPDAELDEKTLKFARRLAAGPTRAHAVTKRLLREYLDHGVRAADDLTPTLASALFETDDMRGGIESLLEHGPGKATFKGR